MIVKGEARFASGEIDRLRGPLNDWIKEARGRGGCLSYSYAVDLADPNVLHVIETWDDEAAIDAHMADLGPLIQILAGAKMMSLRVDAFEARFVKILMGE
jgi:hypothetical protein